MALKLHLGCGTIIKPGYVNCDIADLPGVDKRVDFTQFPWPFEDGAASLIEMHACLEHLPDVVRTMEELYRIAAPGATVIITVPYYNSLDYGSDITHKHPFTQHSMDFFDPCTRVGKERGYYSKAKFHIQSIDYWFVFVKWIKTRSWLGHKILGALAFLFCNVIRGLTFHLEKV